MENFLREKYGFGRSQIYRLITERFFKRTLMINLWLAGLILNLRIILMTREL